MSKKCKAWIEAMRLRTLPVSIAGVLTGTAIAIHLNSFKWLPAVICLLFAIIAQIASNFANEYYDFRNGFDRKGRVGFRRGVTEGDLSPLAMKRATYFLLGIDALLGLSLLLFGPWWLILVGAAIGLFAIGYSTGPYPLSHHGLGDVAVIIFFGIVPVTLTAYLQTNSWDILPITLPIALSTGLLGANVLIVNNYRDCDDDRSVGKHTTVVIFGRRTMANIYLTGGCTAIIILAVFFFGTLSSWWLIVPTIWLVLQTAVWWRLINSDGEALNPLLGKTALLLSGISLLMVVGAIFPGN